MIEKDLETGVEIAVIGMTGRFPGAPNVDTFWDNLRNGLESISFFSDEELEKKGVPSSLIRNPHYVKSPGGLFEHIEHFDAAFFDYTPMEAERLRDLGGEVLYFGVDAVDRWEMLEVIRQGEERLGLINGVIHSAGIIRGNSFKTIADIGEPECQEQFKPKLYGLLVLEQLIKEKELDFCLMISSISTVLGGLEFVAYSAANHFMNAFSLAHNRKKREPWIIVNWDGTSPENTRTAFQRIFSLDTVEQVIFSNGGDL